jgi:hypothetical protein
MAYAFDQVFAADPANPANIASNAAITIYQPGDPTKTPLVITDPSGGALSNPIPVNANGFGSAFMHATLDRVAWDGGGFTGFFTSYDGMKAEAVAARTAAQEAAATAGANAVAELETRIAAGEFEGAPGLDGSNVLPTSEAVEQALTTDGPAKTALAASVTTQAAAQVPPLVADAIANDPSVATSAAALAQSDAGLARKSDPGVPAVQYLGDQYVVAQTDKVGRLSQGTLTDGTVHTPRAKADRSDIAGHVTEKLSATYGILKGTVDSAGRQAEDSIGSDGKVPAWVLQRWSERMPGIPADPAKRPMHIFVMGGQSNSAAADELPAAVEDLPVDPRCFQWNATLNTILPMVSEGYNEAVYASFAREYARTSLPDGYSVLVVPAGLGSTGFSTTSIDPPPAGYYYYGAGIGSWDRTLTSDPVNLYARMISRSLSAKAAAPAGSVFKGLLWSQGEADVANRTESQYAALLDDMLNQARTDLSAPTMRAVIGSMVPEWVDALAIRNTIQKALVDTPRRVERTAFAWGPENLTDMQSNIHWASQGQEARGPIFLDAYKRARYNVTGTEPIPPQKVTAKRTGGTVLVDWEHPPSRATSFELEYRVDAGGWTAFTLSAPLARNAELAITLPPASTFGVRLRTVNNVGISAYTREVRA